jgi:DNA-directed RNA polymerase II subunit RPB1
MQLGIMDSDTKKRMSQGQIRSNTILQRRVPRPDSVNSARLGTYHRDLECTSCSGDMDTCEGHFGDCVLALAVYHVRFIHMTLAALKLVCKRCSRRLFDPRIKPFRDVIKNFKGEDRTKRLATAIERKQLVVCRGFGVHKMKKGDVFDLQKFMATPEAGCGYVQPKWKRDGMRIIPEYPSKNPFVISKPVTTTGGTDAKEQVSLPTTTKQRKKRKRKHDDDDDESTNSTENGKTGSLNAVEEVFTAQTAKRILGLVSRQTNKLMGFKPSIGAAVDTIIDNHQIPPVCIRPPKEYTEADGARGHHDVTAKSLSIIKIENTIEDVLDRITKWKARQKMQIRTREEQEERNSYFEYCYAVAAHRYKQSNSSNSNGTGNGGSSFGSRRTSMIGTVKDFLKHVDDLLKNDKNEKLSTKTNSTTTSTKTKKSNVATAEAAAAALWLQDITLELGNQPTPLWSEDGALRNKDHVNTQQPNYFTHQIPHRARKTDVESILHELLAELHMELQYEVWTLLDNSSQGVRPDVQRSGQVSQDLFSRLADKEGRLRGNLNGKRVNFSSRAAISPGAWLDLDEVGVPMMIAKTLTTPEPVNLLNYHECLAAVHVGTDGYPGANNIILNDGSNVELKYQDTSGLLVMPNWVIERHMKDGDPCVFNRQPSIHKMSMMCHRAKILRKGKTIRLNPGAAEPYNADYDGDEMNLHAGMHKLAAAECFAIMSVKKQILNPKDGSPTMRLVQDSASGLYMLLRKNVFFNRGQIMQLLAQGKRWTATSQFRLPPPVIYKPQELWTGFSVFNAILQTCGAALFTINVGGADGFGSLGSEKETTLLTSETQVERLENWEKWSLLRAGELLCGRWTKGQASQLVKILARAGPDDIINRWLSDMQFILTKYQSTVSSSLSLAHCAEAPEVAKRKEDIIEKAVAWCNQFKDAKSGTVEDERIVRMLNYVRQQLGDAQLQFMRKHADIERNGMVEVVDAGAKGNPDNTIQISVMLGQQLSNSERVQDILPHFDEDIENGAIEHGFVKNGFARGLYAYEFFYHLLAAREGVVDTAVRTSKVGYMQRRLLKALESLSVHWDRSVRDADGNLIQLLYGDDDLDGCRTELVTLRTFAMSDSQLANDYFCDVKQIEWAQPFLTRATYQRFEKQVIGNQKEEIEKQFQNEFEILKKYRNAFRTSILSNNSKSAKVELRVGVRIPGLLVAATCRSNSTNKQSDVTPWEVLEMLMEFESRISKPGDNRLLWSPPTKGTDEQASYRHAFLAICHDWLNPKKLMELKLSRADIAWLFSEVENQLAQARIAAHEMVGPIAAQAVGQPSLQMTLNTFHYAGQATGVPQGLPRLEELVDLRDAAIQGMTIAIRTRGTRGRMLTKPEAAARRLAATLPFIRFGDIVENCKVINVNEPSEDQWFIDLHEKFQPAHDLSPWCIRFEMKKAVCLERQLQLFKLVEIIQNAIFKAPGHQWIFSPTTSDKWIIRFRMHTRTDRYKNLALQGGGDIFTGMEGMMRRMCRTIHVQGIRGIRSARVRHTDRWITQPSNDNALVNVGEYLIDTKGANLDAVLKLPWVDGARTFSNDVKSTIGLRGIEGGARWQEEQLHNLMEANKSPIDRRHNKLIASSMMHFAVGLGNTRNGTISKRKSPMAQCSFEVPGHVIVSAAISSLYDRMAGPTERLMMGAEVAMGTGTVRLLTLPPTAADHVRSDQYMKQHKKQVRNFRQPLGSLPKNFLDVSKTKSSEVEISCIYDVLLRCGGSTVTPLPTVLPHSSSSSSNNIKQVSPQVSMTTPKLLPPPPPPPSTQPVVTSSTRLKKEVKPKKVVKKETSVMLPLPPMMGEFTPSTSNWNNTTDTWRPSEPIRSRRASSSKKKPPPPPVPPPPISSPPVLTVVDYTLVESSSSGAMTHNEFMPAEPHWPGRQTIKRIINAPALPPVKQKKRDREGKAVQQQQSLPPPPPPPPPPQTSTKKVMMEEEEDEPVPLPAPIVQPGRRPVVINKNSTGNLEMKDGQRLDWFLKQCPTCKVNECMGKQCEECHAKLEQDRSLRRAQQRELDARHQVRQQQEEPQRRIPRYAGMTQNKQNKNERKQTKRKYPETSTAKAKTAASEYDIQASAAKAAAVQSSFTIVEELDIETPETSNTWAPVESAWTPVESPWAPVQSSWTPVEPSVSVSSSSSSFVGIAPMSPTYDPEALPPPKPSNFDEWFASYRPESPTEDVPEEEEVKGKTQVEEYDPTEPSVFVYDPECPAFVPTSDTTG